MDTDLARTLTATPAATLAGTLTCTLARGGRARLVQALIATAGLLSLVGSGGGGSFGFPDLSCMSETGGCPITGDLPPTPYAYIPPGPVTVQVGTPVVFTVLSNIDQPTYRWCRQSAATAPCNEIAGATGATYTLASANLGDDGATFRVTVSGAIGSTWATAELAVSSMPGVVFQDGDFNDADWAVSTVATPAVDGPTYALARDASGGHPGANRTATYTFPLKPSSVRSFFSHLAAQYDPATQGAIYRIDFREDCLHGPESNLLPYTGPMLEQAGRRYIASKAALYCAASTWTTLARASLAAGDFTLHDGPACGTAEACPDFSAQGAPIRLGLTAGAALESGLVPPVLTSHRFDNWKVTVWRR